MAIDIDMPNKRGSSAGAALADKEAAYTGVPCVPIQLEELQLRRENSDLLKFLVCYFLLFFACALWKSHAPEKVPPLSPSISRLTSPEIFDAFVNYHAASIVAFVRPEANEWTYPAFAEKWNAFADQNPASQHDVQVALVDCEEAKELCQKHNATLSFSSWEYLPTVLAYAKGGVNIGNASEPGMQTLENLRSTAQTIGILLTKGYEDTMPDVPVYNQQEEQRFRKFLQSNEHAFVLFETRWYNAPSLAPTWSSLASNATTDLGVPVVRVDCTYDILVDHDSATLCRSQNVTSNCENDHDFPMPVVWYTNGSIVEHFNMTGRNQMPSLSELQEFINKMIGMQPMTVTPSLETNLSTAATPM